MANVNADIPMPAVKRRAFYETKPNTRAVEDAYSYRPKDSVSISSGKNDPSPEIAVRRDAFALEVFSTLKEQGILPEDAVFSSWNPFKKTAGKEILAAVGDTDRDGYFDLNLETLIKGLKMKFKGIDSDAAHDALTDRFNPFIGEASPSADEINLITEARNELSALVFFNQVSDPHNLEQVSAFIREQYSDNLTERGTELEEFINSYLKVFYAGSIDENGETFGMRDDLEITSELVPQLSKDVHGRARIDCFGFAQLHKRFFEAADLRVDYYTAYVARGYEGEGHIQAIGRSEGQFMLIGNNDRVKFIKGAAPDDTNAVFWAHRLMREAGIASSLRASPETIREIFGKDNKTRDVFFRTVNLDGAESFVFNDNITIHDIEGLKTNRQFTVQKKELLIKLFFQYPPEIVTNTLGPDALALYKKGEAVNLALLIKVTTKEILNILSGNEALANASPERIYDQLVSRFNEIIKKEKEQAGISSLDLQTMYNGGASRKISSELTATINKITGIRNNLAKAEGIFHALSEPLSIKLTTEQQDYIIDDEFASKLFALVEDEYIPKLNVISAKYQEVLKYIGQQKGS